MAALSRDMRGEEEENLDAPRGTEKTPKERGKKMYTPYRKRRENGSSKINTRAARKRKKIFFALRGGGG